jgi:hypothetical protein
MLYKYYMLSYKHAITCFLSCFSVYLLIESDFENECLDFKKLLELDFDNLNPIKKISLKLHKMCMFLNV